MIEALLALFDYVRNGSISSISIIILIILSFVQISPIKLNPYDKFFSWLRTKLLGDFDEDIKDFRERIDSVWINFNRQHILRFARECRQNINHSRDEWRYVLSIANDYEKYCRDNNLTNGIIEAETEYIRDLYQERIQDGNFA